ncbi:NAD(P)/FAD-dependent oxidoreductase [Pelagibaculum spongiae]|uniref:FAD/NAD(P)-binding oxidoreductase n=1 Tax=Pelagibaculum spongiae TaxID=2080658 RepID=A0A2V1H087_9GAMM|nr:NAD(P)/FAD-dependent oxidoreductase [Pelagibaculum spongiae]PVZ72416.1 FAD/NAD(P)-binding oxidoreductase [Pelagibaculum spongiae]
MNKNYDIAIIGAGPAGMAAAITASKEASVIVINNRPQAGGQIYNKLAQSPLEKPQTLGPDYTKGLPLLEQFESCSAEKIHGASVWHAGDNGEVLISEDGHTKKISARHLVIATGAMERPFPISGWQLDGVMTAGSAQVMLKSEGLVRENAIFAGTGPLLYLIVAQYLRLGVKVAAIIDTTPMVNYIQASTSAIGAIRMPKMITKGIGLLAEIAKSGTPFYRFAKDLQVTEQDGKASGVQFKANGKTVKLESQDIFLHQGVVPNLNMARSMDLPMQWDEVQLCWKPILNSWGQSKIEHISVAGDSSGIVGADGSEMMGYLVGLNLLHQLKYISKEERDQKAKPFRQEFNRQSAFRPFAEKLYRPIDSHRLPSDDSVVVCRCEEVLLGELKEGFRQGATDPNQLKNLTRCGMGPCQGRMCGHTVSELVAQWNQQTVAEAGYYRLRSPMQLLTLQELSLFTEIRPGDRK